MLENVNSPADLKALPEADLPALAEEIREKIIKTVSQRGGHLSPNLGSVELTLAVHRVFSAPEDTLIFDVGHQCYTHKLITGRRAEFETLREQGSVSGFTSKNESEYDAVTAGHSGPAVSEALGVATSKKLRGDETYTVAISGDGSFTNGMVYEALNNCAAKGLRLIIILNDNGMLISEAVGGFSKHLSRIRTSERYFAFKCGLKKFFSHIPLIGRALVSGARRIKESLKRLFLNTNIFEALGIEYLGPVDGNDVSKVISVLEEAKTRDEVVLVHLKTKKGLGYPPAEAEPDAYHFVPPFDPERGTEKDPATFCAAVSAALLKLGEEDERVVAVTAAMPEGTGTAEFGKRFPERFFDVGIAEEHAASFSSGLALGGMRPFCAVYSTFAQRIFDQVLEDSSLQGLPVTYLLSHAGFVPGDGSTHQGIFDVALFSSVPGVTVLSPDSRGELSELIAELPEKSGPRVIRYPKGREADYPRDRFVKTESGLFVFNPEAEVLIVTYGRVTAQAYDAADLLAPVMRVGVVRFTKIAPLDGGALFEAVRGAKEVFFIEEGIKRGGFAESAAAYLGASGYKGRVVVHAIEDEFPPHGDLDFLLDKYGFTSDAIARRILSGR
ncbi:MAG: 1-deoxy-D-xylulose-5-phosphate synthase [Clostridia bacterium]|nr:1-deoxy-D-xylulose-5-phosphate synthase [Clostridia bacterium]